jgi:hypothetical protein
LSNGFLGLDHTTEPAAIPNQDRFHGVKSYTESLDSTIVSSPVIVAMLTHDGALPHQNPSAPDAYSQKSYAPAEQPPVVPAPAQLETESIGSVFGCPKFRGSWPSTAQNPTNIAAVTCPTPNQR